MESIAEMATVGLEYESNWIEAHGSLQDCIHVFKPHQEDEGDGRKALVLRSPQQKCGPCQITIKFMQKQCKVCSIYVRSSIQVYELYSMSALFGDREYICTVHGEIAIGSYDPSNNKGNISQNQIYAHSKTSSMGEDRSQSPKKQQDHYKGLVDMQNLAGGKPKVNMLPMDNVEFPNCISRGDSQKSHENWVGVKFSGFLEIDSSCEAGGVSRLQTLDNTKYEKDSADQKSETSAVEDYQKIPSPTFHKPASTKNIDSHVLYREKRIGTESISASCLIEEDWTAESIRDDNSILDASTKMIRPGRRLYEGTVEIVNAKPCSSLTIQFPSIQDKCSVKIEEILIYALPAMEVMDGMESRDFSNLFGNSLGDSLLAMLGSSIFEFSRDGKSQRQDALFVSQFHDSDESDLSGCSCSDISESSECGWPLSEHSSSSFQSLVNIPTFTENSAASPEQYVSCGRYSGETFSSEFPFHEIKLPYPVLISGDCPDDAGESIGMYGNDSRGTLGINLDSNYDIDETCGQARQDGLHSDFLKSVEIDRAREHMENGLEPNVECSTHRSSRGWECLKTKEACMGDNEQHNRHTMQQLFEHINRLEAMCGRIEVNMLTLLDKMEKRIQLLELQHMPEDQSLKRGMHQKTFNASRNSPSECFSSSSTKIPKDQLKHESFMDAPSLSSTEIPLVPTSLISSVSVTVCSSAIVTSSSYSPLPCHELNKNSSTPVNYMDCVPYHSSPLPSGKESTKHKCSESSSNALHESIAVSLNPQGLSDKVADNIMNNWSNDMQAIQYASEVINTAAVDSHLSVPKHTITTVKNLSHINEAIASALAAFSASTHRVEASESANTTCSTAAGNLKNDDTYDCPYLYPCGEVRFKTQVGMESPVFYGSPSQDNLDLRPTLKRGYRNESKKAGDFVDVRQACKQDNLPEINYKKKHAKKKHIARDVWPNMATYEPDYQKQYQPRHCSSLKQKKEACNLVWDESADGRSPCRPCNNVIQKTQYKLPPIKTKLSIPNREVTEDSSLFEPDYARETHENGKNMHISPFSYFSSVTYNSYPERESAEAFLCNLNPPSGKDVGWQTYTETISSVNMAAPNHPHYLFFIEDEGLGDFVTPNTSNSPCTVPLNNYSHSEATVPGEPLGFERLLL